MYIFPEMIDMGLQEGQEWPTEYHKIVAQNVLLCNETITTRDALTQGVQNILKIPEDKIKTITFEDLSKYGFGLITTVSLNET